MVTVARTPATIAGPARQIHQRCCPAEVQPGEQEPDRHDIGAQVVLAQDAGHALPGADPGGRHRRAGLTGVQAGHRHRGGNRGDERGERHQWDGLVARGGFRQGGPHRDQGAAAGGSGARCRGTLRGGRGDRGRGGRGRTARGLRAGAGSARVSPAARASASRAAWACASQSARGSQPSGGGSVTGPVPQRSHTTTLRDKGPGARHCRDMHGTARRGTPPRAGARPAGHPAPGLRPLRRHPHRPARDGFGRDEGLRFGA